MATKRIISAVDISGVNLLRGEKSSDGLVMLSEM
jgi:hypothetical protein